MTKEFTMSLVTPQTGTLCLLAMVCCLTVVTLRSQSKRRKAYGFHQLTNHSINIFQDDDTSASDDEDIKFLPPGAAAGAKSKVKSKYYEL